MLPLATTRGRHGITEPERDELHQSGIIAMRQVTALMPPEKAERPFLVCQRTKRLVLRVNQLAEMITFGAQNHFGAPNSDSARWGPHPHRAESEFGAPILRLRHQLPQYVRQHPAVLVVLDYNRRICAAAHRHVRSEERRVGKECRSR